MSLLAGLLSGLVLLLSPSSQAAPGTGAISGTVLDDEGQPLPRPICVGAEGIDLRRGGSARVDEAGHYRIGGLPTGSYGVLFLPHCARGPAGSNNPVPECYSDTQLATDKDGNPKGHCESPDPVPVLDGQETYGIDAELGYVAGARMSAKRKGGFGIKLVGAAQEAVSLRFEGQAGYKRKGGSWVTYHFGSERGSASAGQRATSTLKLTNGQRKRLLRALRFKSTQWYMDGAVTFKDHNGTVFTAWDNAIYCPRDCLRSTAKQRSAPASASGVVKGTIAWKVGFFVPSGGIKLRPTDPPPSKFYATLKGRDKRGKTPDGPIAYRTTAQARFVSGAPMLRRKRWRLTVAVGEWNGPGERRAFEFPRQGPRKRFFRLLEDTGQRAEIQFEARLTDWLGDTQVQTARTPICIHCKGVN